MKYEVGQKIIYGENGVCTVEYIAPLDISGSDPEKLYYHLTPLVGTGTFFAPIDTAVFMRPLIGRDDALRLIDSYESIEPAICDDNRFNHVDAFYKELFKLHSPEAMIAVIKGLKIRISEKKTKSSRAESTLKRAKEILYGELSVVLEIPFSDMEQYIIKRLGC